MRSPCLVQIDSIALLSDSILLGEPHSLGGTRCGAGTFIIDIGGGTELVSARTRRFVMRSISEKPPSQECSPMQQTKSCFARRVLWASARVGMLLCSTLALVPITRAQTYSVTDLGTLGGTLSWALGIDSSGRIVGYADTANGVSHAFLWSEGQMQDLGALGDSDSTAYAVNASERVVGSSDNVNGSTHAFLWTQPGGMQALNGAELATFVSAINASGQMAGA